jgi:hypothetical protein
MHDFKSIFPALFKYKGQSIESLQDLLRSMVEKAELTEVDDAEKTALFKDIDELHGHILELLHSEEYALSVLMVNYSEVYDEVYKIGENLQGYYPNYPK